MQESRVCAIILNWNGWQDTLVCIDSLKSCGYDNLTILMVDNGSTNDSVARIRSAHPDVEIIETGLNLGYAAGNNIGIERAIDLGCQYVLILNNDIEVTPGFMQPLLRQMQDAEVGAVSPKVLYPDKKTIYFIGGVFRWNTGGAEHVRHLQQDDNAEREPFATDFVPGCSFFTRGDYIQRVGFIPLDYFLMSEDIDWSMMFGRQGFKLVVVPESVVYHRESASMGGWSALKRYYYVRNTFILMKKYADPDTYRAFVRTFSIRCLKDEIKLLLRGEWSPAKGLARGYVDYYRGIKGKMP